MIAFANHLAGQDDIEIGQTLARPGLNRRHVVDDDDSWAQLSQCWYGDPTLEELIASANHLSVELPPHIVLSGPRGFLRQSAAVEPLQIHRRHAYQHAAFFLPVDGFTDDHLRKHHAAQRCPNNLGHFAIGGIIGD